MAREFLVGDSDKIEYDFPVITVEPTTLACWARPTTDISVARTLVSVGNHLGAGFFRVGFTSTGPTVFLQKQANDGSNEVVNTSGTVSINNWYHCAAVFSSTTSRTVYRDGANSASGATLLGSAATGRTSIGIQAGNLASPRPHNGMIAEVGIWDVALTPDEIISLAKGFCPRLIRTGNLVFYAPLVREINDMMGLPIVDSGTTYYEHPRIIY